ncbi:MAG: inositol monophosphatase [Myxococcales bacterium]|nr:inositol monophosphatase [Myxococcales bacterium]
MDPLAAAIAIAREAGALLAEGQGRRHAATVKSSPFDLVTEYDRRAEELILARLRAAFPGDRILAEESGLSGTASGARWVVDPLDGTTNFAHGLPLFAVSIAREVAGVVEVGVVHAPALGLTFAARRGDGATCNGAPIRVSDCDHLAAALLATGFPTDRQTSDENNFAQFIAFQRRAQGVRRLGSAALDLALVARGTYDGFWEMKLKPWDVAAGALLVVEAGGTVSGWSGEALAIDRGAVVASNGRLHAAMLATLATLPLPSAAQPPVREP